MEHSEASLSEPSKLALPIGILAHVPWPESTDPTAAAICKEIYALRRHKAQGSHVLSPDLFEDGAMYRGPESSVSYLKIRYSQSAADEGNWLLLTFT